MKTSFLILLLALALTGCSKLFTSRTFSPIHTNLEVYVTSNVGNGQGTMQPHFGEHIVPRLTLTFKDGDDTYTAAIEYKGTYSTNDYYWVTLTAPPGTVGVPAPAEIAYAGQPIELWSDAKEHIGIRPLK